MPQYFFDSDDGTKLISDQIGMELDDHQQMRFQAIDALPDMARDVLPDSDHREMVVTVRDGDGNRIFRAKLTLSVEWLTPSSGGRTAR